MPDANSILACDPGAIPPGARGAHARLIAALFHDRRTVRTHLPGGLAYSFGVARLTEVARFIDNERRCCPFLDFTLRLPAGATLVSLEITGPPGTRTFLDLELSR